MSRGLSTPLFQHAANFAGDPAATGGPARTVAGAPAYATGGPARTVAGAPA